jgi:hypothetical protein
MFPRYFFNYHSFSLLFYQSNIINSMFLSFSLFSYSWTIDHILAFNFDVTRSFVVVSSIFRSFASLTLFRVCLTYCIVTWCVVMYYDVFWFVLICFVLVWFCLLGLVWFGSLGFASSHFILCLIISRLRWIVNLDSVKWNCIVFNHIIAYTII